MEAKAYCIILEMKEPLSANGLKNYREFLNVIDTSNPHAMGCPNIFPEKYDSETSVFYATGSKEDAFVFAEKAKKTGLVKAINVEEI